MSATVLHPSPRQGVVFNIADYDDARRSFRWAEAAADLTGPHGLNIAEVAVDRHSRGALAAKVALRWRGKHGDARDIT